MPKQLTTHNATITTAAVEVKTLTISGKQVTLAVFRQLREEPLISEDGTLNGVPWGTVNYHPDKCSDDGHWHIVWQRGDELLRSAIDKTPGFDRRSSRSGEWLPAHGYRSTVANRFLTASTYTALRADLSPLLVTTDAYGSVKHQAAAVLGDTVNGPVGFPVWAEATKEATIAADLGYLATAARKTLEGGFSDYQMSRSEEWKRSTHEYRQRRAEETQAEYEPALESLCALVERWGGYEAIKSRYGAELKQERDRRQRHRDLRVTLAELPQLFIAV